MTAVQICEFVFLGMSLGFGVEALCWACSKLIHFMEVIS